MRLPGPRYPERTYSGTVARIARALDQKTRTMAVELDVVNRDGSLAPGMYPTVKWPVRRSRPALFVPKTSVVTTTERTFVVRDRNGRAEWVDVRKGPRKATSSKSPEACRPGTWSSGALRTSCEKARPYNPSQMTRSLPGAS